MAGSMSRADLVADLKASLHDAASVFTEAADAAFIRHLDLAALDFWRIRPRTLLGEITLVADQLAYAAPADMAWFKSALWGEDRKAQPWEKTWPGRLPMAQMVEGATAMELHLNPPPTASQISLLGSAYKFWYYGAHAIADTAADTTIRPADRGLLLLRAQAEAMKEMASRNIHKPVQLRDGLGSAPRNSTPSGLYDLLMQQFTEAAR